jgi:hypothetical protein
MFHYVKFQCYILLSYLTLYSNTVGNISLIQIEVEVGVTLRPTVSQSVNMSWCRAHSGTCDQILLPVRRFLSESCGLVSVGSPL